MKKVNIVLFCSILCFGMSVAFPGFGQEKSSKDDLLLRRIGNAFNLIPRDLAVEEFLRQMDEVEGQVKQAMDSLSGKEAKRKARLLRYNGVLWSEGYRAMETQDTMLKKDVARRIAGLDLDSPDLDLLDGVEPTNLINGYLQLFMPDLSALARGTYVLYNIKSEKVRNPYVMTTLVTEFKKSGYTDDVKGLLEDIELCSKTEETRRKAVELKDKYYPVRPGQIAPDFEMEDENGKLVKLSDFQGKAVFIDVWATWCGGCVEGLPYFMALKDQYKDRKDVVFLTISDDGVESKMKWKDFLKEKQYSGKVPHLIINKDKDRFMEDYCITGIPRYILIDKEGKIVNAWHIGAKHELFSFFFSMELNNMNRE